MAASISSSSFSSFYIARSMPRKSTVGTTGSHFFPRRIHSAHQEEREERRHSFYERAQRRQETIAIILTYETRVASRLRLWDSIGNIKEIKILRDEETLIRGSCYRLSLKGWVIPASGVYQGTRTCDTLSEGRRSLCLERLLATVGDSRYDRSGRQLSARGDQVDQE